MVYRWLFQHFLGGFAQQKLREAAVEAVQQELAAQAEAAARQRPCDVAVTFALGQESGGLEDLLEDVVHIRGEGFSIRQGLLAGRNVSVAITGAGRRRAIRAVEAVLTAHRPSLVISAGFCGGLAPEVERHEILVADTLLDAEGSELRIRLDRIGPELTAAEGVHVGPIVQCGRILRLPGEKRALGEATGALGADLESLAVAEVCRARDVPFLVVRTVSDAMDEKLPREVENLLRQTSRAAQFGAAFGAILDRPGSLKAMLRLRENALVASDRLAAYLGKVIKHAVPVPSAAATDEPRSSP